MQPAHTPREAGTHTQPSRSDDAPSLPHCARANGVMRLGPVSHLESSGAECAQSARSRSTRRCALAFTNGEAHAQSCTEMMQSCPKRSARSLSLGIWRLQVGSTITRAACVLPSRPQSVSRFFRGPVSVRRTHKPPLPRRAFHAQLNGLTAVGADRSCSVAVSPNVWQLAIDHTCRERLEARQEASAHASSTVPEASSDERPSVHRDLRDHARCAGAQRRHGQTTIAHEAGKRSHGRCRATHAAACMLVVGGGREEPRRASAGGTRARAVTVSG